MMIFQRKSARSAGIIFLSILFYSCQNTAQTLSVQEKINGVCLVAPRAESHLDELSSIERISPNFVAIVPYAYKRDGESFVNFHQENEHWWGEGVEGARKTIQKCKTLNLKIMLKPHVWVVGQGWAGDFKPSDTLSAEERENQWLLWQHSYSDYILALTKVAVEEKVEIFCIGTEYRHAVKERPEFWKNLIDEIRKEYSGKITYAANWDNYQNVSFWDRLDMIGIDVYFPLSESKQPNVQELEDAWEPIKSKVLYLVDSVQKPLIFTEYGYRSIAYTARGDWKNKEVKELDEKAQLNAYQALYNSWWKEEQFAGGFLWKWFPADSLYRERGREGRFSPQGKIVEKVIKEQYED